MTQVQVLYTFAATNFAEAIVRGLLREGYDTYWDPESGPMSSRAIALAERAHCIVVWTRDALYSKWPLEIAQRAHERGSLIEVTLDPIESQFEGAVEQPLNFAEWDGKYAGPLWLALMQRVRATAGRPTGKLPLKEEAQPAMLMGGFMAAAATALALGGVPQPNAPVESIAYGGAGGLPSAAESTAVGGAVGAREPASAKPIRVAPLDSDEAEPAVTYQFDMMAPAPSPQIVPLKDLPSAEGADLAAAQSDEEATKPNS
jgi:hypothetical protein